MRERAAVTHRGQAAFEVVRPGVVGADDAPAATAARTVEQPRRAMAAHIVENPYCAVVAAQGKQHLADEVEALVIAGLRNLGYVADDLPRRTEDALPFQREELGIRIRPRGQAEILGGRLIQGM